MIKVDKFCGCCSLKTGATILGIVFLIWGFILASVGSVALMATTVMQLFAFFMVIMIIGILELLAASSLLFGVCNIKPHFIVPMLILFPVDIALWIISISILCYRWFGIVFLVILIPIYVYFWVSIFSYWRQMKEKPRRAFRNWETGVVHEAPAVQETTVV